MVDPRHARDRHAAVDAVAHEHRVDEMRCGELGLPHKAAQEAGLAQATHAGCREHDLQLRGLSIGAMPPDETVSLRPVTRANVRTICDLELADSQRRLVAPSAYTVAEGNYEPGAVLRAIYRGDRPVGVLLVKLETGTPYLVRFMVDAQHQRAGVGRRAVELLVDELRAAGWSVLETSHARGADGPGAFWRHCGFEPTGRELHDEPVLMRAL